MRVAESNSGIGVPDTSKLGTYDRYLMHISRIGSQLSVPARVVAQEGVRAYARHESVKGAEHRDT